MFATGNACAVVVAKMLTPTAFHHAPNHPKSDRLQDC